MSEESPLSPKRTVTLPFAFGEIVYYRGRPEKVPGVVFGFVVVSMGIKILVRWTDDMCQIEHSFYELTTEFIPEFPSET